MCISLFIHIMDLQEAWYFGRQFPNEKLFSKITHNPISHTNTRYPFDDSELIKPLCDNTNPTSFALSFLLLAKILVCKCSEFTRHSYQGRIVTTFEFWQLINEEDTLIKMQFMKKLSRIFRFK